ncbi:MAG: hypothetical protein KJ852_11085 [Gammaproteobacteria bacterium]|jgi:hypothetical protein|nr:hypothetical protein [Gammaproteobacteria bacterium]MBU0785369.1 hypothetical protein [Gammaproteobacteria bacterium]MBU0815952.1 hypothetical protein [Gammaproteobacteria bacterium]MBU1787491.1 hypothetical protein [Gammaproteobacteria bacterium]
MLTRTTLGIVSAQLPAYPQAEADMKTYPSFGYIREAGSPTPFNIAQVLDKKGENSTIHR